MTQSVTSIDPPIAVRPQARSATPLLAATRISTAFNGTPALADVDFDIVAGEVHALVGENGAGKSSLMKILGGLYLPDAGSIDVAGARVDFRTTADAMNAGIAIIHQE